MRALISVLATAVLAMSCDAEIIEPSQTLRGTVRHLTADDFENGKSQDLLVLDTDDGRHIDLDIGEALPHQATEITGHFEGERFRVESALASDTATVQQRLTGTGTRRALVLLFNFASNPVQPYTRAEAQAALFGPNPPPGTDSVTHRLSDMSHGALTDTGDVFGWYTINNSMNNCASSYTTWSNAALSAFRAAGGSTAGYDHFMFVFAGPTSCPWAGMGETPGKNVWILGYDISALSFLAVHEIGHNFGFNHANYMHCSGTLASCQSSANEYGDGFDPMGFSPDGRYAAYRQKGLGWIGASDVLTVAVSGTYRINSLAQASGRRGLRLDIANGGYGDFIELDYQGGPVAMRRTSSAYTGYSYLVPPDFVNMFSGSAGLTIGTPHRDTYTTGAALTLSLVAKTATTADVCVQIGTATCHRCGDGVCTGTETCSSCQGDCGQCPFSVSASTPSPVTVKSTYPLTGTANAPVSSWRWERSDDGGATWQPWDTQQNSQFVAYGGCYTLHWRLTATRASDGATLTSATSTFVDIGSGCPRIPL